MSKYLIKSLGTSIAGTAMMTLSSALMSLEGQEFREPSHLAALISRLVPVLSSEEKKLAGWAAHFSMGMAFSFVYVTLWERRMVRPHPKKCNGDGPDQQYNWNRNLENYILASPLVTNHELQAFLPPAHSGASMFCNLCHDRLSADKNIL